MMEATPRPALEMIQSQFFLHLLVALLHRPATLPEPNRFDPAGTRRQVREGILNLAVGSFLDQQPDRLGTRTSTFGPAQPRPNADPGELRRQLPLGPLTPGDLVPRQTFGQRFEAHGSRTTRGQARSPPAAAGRLRGPVPARL